MASVSISEVSKSFGQTDVIHQLSVEIDDGEFVAVVGPSGCGKSTLLRIIAGLESVTAGTITIGSKVINDLAPKERDIAMVFQNYALYPHMSVRRNMSFALKLQNIPLGEIQRRVSNAAEILDLGSLLERFPRQLSGGQRQRVAMGRAIVREPKVFLFDEPLSNLDAQLRVRMRTEIRALHHRLRTTTIFVTHDQIEAMTMADKIVVMRAGKVEQVGSPLDLYDNPSNVFVAGFIGSPAMNLFKGSINMDANGSLIFKSDDGTKWPVPDGLLVRSTDVIYGIRPEHFQVLASGTPGQVVVVETTGSETQVLAKIGTSDVLANFRERVAFRPDDTIMLKPMLAHVHLFDATSGHRINLPV